MAKRTVEERFWSKVALPDANGCLVWAAHIDAKGYGRFNWNRAAWRAHQVAYALAGERVPAGKVLDHICRNRACVNVVHLEPVTSGENTRRGVNANRRKTHCVKGHAFSEENTRVTVTQSRTHRACRACDRERRKL